MKKLFVSVFLFSILFAWACLPQPVKVESAVGITAPDGYSVTCATNYTRRVPHFCARTSNYTQSSVSPLDASCRSITFSPAPPSNAVLGVFSYDVILSTQNAVGNVNVGVNFYSDSGCTTGSYIIARGEREWVATPAVGFSVSRTTFLAPLVSGALYYTANGVVGTGHTVLIGIVGYYD
jgi:hypothetical protein